MPLPRAPSSPSDAAEAARILRAKSLLTPADFKALDAETKKRAITVTDEVSLDAIRQMRDALAKAKADGVPYREFVKTVGPTLHAKWGIDSPQLKTIFVNNVQQATNQAIVARLNRQRGKYPFWTIDVVEDEVTSAYCSFFVTYPLVLAAGHPWFAKNAPMRHHRCRSTLRGLTAAEAKKIGITKSPPDWPPQEGWGGSAPMGAYKASDREASITMATKKVKADLGPADVHVDGPMRVKKPIKKVAKTIGGKLAAAQPKKALRGRFAFRFQRNGTHLEIRHMSDRTVRCAGVEIDLAQFECADGAVEEPRVWNQLAKCGQFRGHPSGPFELTPQIFAEIVANFRATQNQRIPIDFEHASEQDPTQGTIPTEGAPAQGWIVDLDNRGAMGLWGLVAWLEPARTYVREKKYRYFSPAIRFGAKDRVSGQPIGARMTSGALTNIPFLDGMMPLAASDRGEGTVESTETISMGDYAHSMAEVMPKLRAGLFEVGSHLATMATVAECYDAVCRLESMCTEYRDASPDGDIMSAVHAGAPLGMALMRLRDAMQMGMGITVPEMLAIVKAMIERAMGKHVDDMHEDDAAESADMRDTNMDLKEATVKLTEAETKAATLLNEKASLESKVAGLELTLSERSAKVTALETEVKTLRDDAQKRAEQDETAAIETAFATYKDSHKLTDAHKKSMLLTYRHDRETFDKLYPSIAPDKRHLMHSLSQRQSPGATLQGQGGVPTVVAPPAHMMNQNAWLPSFGGQHVSVGGSPQDRRAYAEKLAALTEEKVGKGMRREQAIVEARRDLTQPQAQTT